MLIKVIFVSSSFFIDFIVHLYHFLISLLEIALFVPIESSTQLISVKNDGEGGVTITNERAETLISTNERTGKLTSDQSQDDSVPRVWVGAIRVSLIATTYHPSSENCENYSQELSFQRQPKMIFGMALGMYDFYASLGKLLMLLCDGNILITHKMFINLSESIFKYKT